MKYFLKIRSNPEADNYLKPLSLHRFENKKKFVTEWWNPETGEWEHSTSVLAASGLGGADDFIEVDKNTAMEFQKSSSRKDDNKKVDKQ